MDTKVCRLCSIEKPVSEYHYSNREKGYLQYCCKDCNRAKTRQFYHEHPGAKQKWGARSNQWFKDNPEKAKLIRRRGDLKKKYGMSEADYAALLASQGGKCAVCQSEDCGRKSGKWADGRFHVDHCHETNRVRGLLCHGCNVRLGGLERLLKDRSIEWILDYIRK